MDGEVKDKPTWELVSQARPNPKSGEGSGHSLYISLFLALCTLRPNQIAERHETSDQHNRKLFNMDVSMIEAAGRRLGFVDLKTKQKEAIVEFVSGKDVFVVLPTGYGKSVCYAIIPLIFDQLRGKTGSVVVIVSPLITLMKDQVESFKSKGLEAAFVGCGDEQGILDGKYQLVYISPEALFQKRVWRDMLQSDVYQNSLVGFIIDEAHCVKKW